VYPWAKPARRTNGAGQALIAHKLPESASTLPLEAKSGIRSTHHELGSHEEQQRGLRCAPCKAEDARATAEERTYAAKQNPSNQGETKLSCERACIRFS
jgi:hypothetical protein